MKKFTLIFAVMLMTSFAFAQRGFVPRIYELGRAQVVKQAKTNMHKATRAPGDVIWSEDFDSVRWAATSNNGSPVPDSAPAGYTLVDNTGNGFFWRWSKEGPRGRYTSPDHSICDHFTPLHSTTESNGFLMFEGDFYNNDDACNFVASPVTHDSYFEFDSLDFSASPNVVLRFEQMSRFCCAYNSTDDAWFETSTDGGSTWISHSVHTTKVNVLTSNPDVVYINLTNDLGGQPNVNIRFRFAMEVYHWEIDDISFIQPWKFDAWLHDYWNDYATVMTRDSLGEGKLERSGQFNGGFFLNPWFLAEDFVGYEAAYENFGSEDLTNFVHHVDIYREGDLYAQLESQPDTIPAAQVDSLFITTDDFANINNVQPNFSEDGKGWRPQYFGKYETVHYCTADSADEDVTNDTMRRSFIITDTMLAYCDTANATRSSCAPDNWTDYTGDGDGVGMSLFLPSPTLHDGGQAGQYYTLSGVDVYIPAQRDEADALIAAGNAKLTVGVFGLNDAGDDFSTTPFLSSAPYVLKSNDTTSWIHIPFAVDGFSEIIKDSANIAVALQFYGSYTTDRQHTFTVGDDEIRKGSGANSLRIFNGGSWGWSYGAPAIVLDIHYPLTNPNAGPGGSTNNPNQLKLKIYPNPSNGLFNTNINGSKQITVINAIGSVVDSFVANGNQIDLTNLQAGVYFVRIKSGNKVGTQQVIIN